MASWQSWPRALSRRPSKMPEFDVKSYGYSKFSKFVENLPSFKIKNNTVMISEN